MNLLLTFLAAATAATLLQVAHAQADPDSDGDGLCDFQEIHKYLTDPHNKDTDGDDIPDGDWRERREYQYTVRSVVQVMRPVTIEYLCDDYQDARILDETADHVELEVFHYPFNTVATAIVADAEWRKHAASMKVWLDPGPTSDWTPELRHALETELQEAGIDVARLDDKTLVERASTWLLQRATFHDGFSTFITAFDAAGKPFVPEDLAADGDYAAQWPRELSARGMFANRCRGSCSSSAIYLSGCLRAVGVPTRTVLVVPIVDASDDSEILMLMRGLTNHEVLRTARTAALHRRGTWSSHTFNEVFVGGRWRRLNYDKLGQNILDPSMFGLVTHVATFRDWADANMPATIGKRQTQNLLDDVFGHNNPYSTIALRDEFGVHCKRGNPVPPPLQAKVTSVRWGDDPTLPDDVRRWFENRMELGFVATVEGPADGADFANFLADADQQVQLVSPGKAPIPASFDPRCRWWKQDHALILVRFGADARRELVAGTTYVFTPRNEARDARWGLPDKLQIERAAK